MLSRMAGKNFSELELRGVHFRHVSIEQIKYKKLQKVFVYINSVLLKVITLLIQLTKQSILARRIKGLE